MKNSIELSGIHIYPVKSLAGIAIEQSTVQQQGIKNDRMYMLVDENYQFITQRKYPQLALVSTRITANGLLLQAPNLSPLTVEQQDFSLPAIAVSIWQDSCSGLVAAEFINHWFSDYLQTAVKLVKYDEHSPRSTDPKYSTHSDIVSFADGFPLLIISEASLDDLNSKLHRPVSMANFRPNILLRGCDAYEEDQWRKICIGGVEFDLVKQCSRCVLTTIDPMTGIKNKMTEPLKTLGQYRKGQDGIFFGMNMIPRSLGKIQINDAVKIIRRSD